MESEVPVPGPLMGPVFLGYVVPPISRAMMPPSALLGTVALLGTAALCMPKLMMPPSAFPGTVAVVA